MRDITWRGFLLIVAGYLVVLRVAGLVFGVDVDADTAIPSAEAGWRNFVAPIGATAVYAAAVVTWLRWWPLVLVDRHAVQRWVLFVPVFMFVIALAGINYGHLGDQPGSLIAALLCTGALIGFTEELMFRGIGVTAFRKSGFSEVRVALWSSLVFGLVHLQNAFGEGSGAIVQAAIVSTSGFFFYLCMRSTGLLLVPMVVHGLWDFSLLSGQVGAEADVAIGTVLPIAAQVILIVVLVVRRHRINLPQAT